MKIEEIEITNLRGCKNTQKITLKTKGTVQNIIIYGDNGTGKSTICDAIEFALQGKIKRTTAFPDATLNASSENELASVAIKFNNNTLFKREIRINKDKKITITPSNLHEKFTHHPIILRRKDILTFWETDKNNRLILFKDFQKTKTTTNQDIDVQINFLNKRDTVLRETKKEKIEALAKFLQLPPHETIPQDRIDFEQFCKAHKEKTKKRRDFNNLRDQIIDLMSEISKVKKELKTLKTNSTGKSIANKITASFSELLQNIATNTHSDFIKIANNHNFINNIEIEAATTTDASFNINIIVNNKKHDPKDILSEANLDLLGFMIYMQFIHEGVQEGQPPIIILDDVLQSIDNTMRLKAFNWVLEKCSDWQIIIATHEKLWTEQLTDIFRKKNMPIRTIHVKQWSFENGISIGEINFDVISLIKEQIPTANTIQICSTCGIILEKVMNELSIIWELAITRRRGDKYTLGDLWPPIQKKLQKTSIENTSEEMNKYIGLRNMIGAHYNEWAQNISTQDALDFANITIKFIEGVKCTYCHEWVHPIKHMDKNNGYMCRCKKTQITTK